MSIHDEYEIEIFLSSKETYEKKIETLQNEKKFAQKMIGIIDERIKSFEEGKYVDKMIEERINNLRALRNWLVTVITTGIISGTELANWEKIEAMLDNPQTETKALVIALLGVFSTSVFVTGVFASIKDTYNEMLFKQRISSYQRRLK